MNGDIDYFWIGGDENRWFYIRQKSTYVVEHDGNYGTYGGRGQSVESNSYWYQSGGQTSQFIHIKDPKCVNVVL